MFGTFHHGLAWASHILSRQRRRPAEAFAALVAGKMSRFGIAHELSAYELSKGTRNNRLGRLQIEKKF
jgi:hypothetical protein